MTSAELVEVFGRLLALPCWPASFDGGPASLAALKYLTSELIGRFCGAAQEATLAGRRGRSRSPGTPPTSSCPGGSGSSARCSRG